MAPWNLLPEQRGELVVLSQALARPEISAKDFNSSRLKLDVGKTENVQGPSGESRDGDESFRLTETQLKTKQLNERLRKNPYDEKLWVELIDLQDQVTQFFFISGFTESAY